MAGNAALVISDVIVCSHVDHGIRFDLQIAPVGKEERFNIPFEYLNITSDINGSLPCVVADRTRNDPIKCNCFIPNFHIGFIKNLFSGCVRRELADIIQVGHTPFRAWIFIPTGS